MASFPFALSVHHFITTVGADVGFASIIGLAILVLLYFAQARETAHLREQAYEAAQRVAQLENRVTQLSRQAPAPAAAAGRGASAANAAQVRSMAAAPAPAGAFAAVPVAPAGVAAPALSAATRLIPVGPVPAVASPVASAPAAEPRSEPAPAAVTPPPVTVAGGTNGSSRSGVAEAPAPVAAPAAAPPFSMQPSSRPAAAAPATAAAARRAAPLPHAAEGDGGNSRRAVVVAAALLTIVAIIAVVFVLTRSNTGSQAATGASRATNASRSGLARSGAAVDPRTVTVAVLNGTATAGLAHRVALRLAALGYKEGQVLNAADQTHTSTIVGYMPGHKRVALQVANTLKLRAGSVQPIDQSAQAVACPPSTTCAATVVVTVGTDLAAQ